MVIMDFKGITWIGNVYQKFEAMCLEVEEIIVQDTVKYVEDQVQTVGASFKNFYSDVVQDLLPESSVDSAKPLPTSMLHECAPVCSFKEKRESTDEEAMKGHGEQLTEYGTRVIYDEGKKDGHAPKVHGLLMGHYDLHPSPRQYKDDGTCRRVKLGAKRISRKEKPARDSIPRVEKHLSLSMAHTPENKDLESSCRKETISSNDSPTEVARFSSTEETSIKSGDGSEYDPAVVESIRNQDSELEQSVTTSMSAGSNDCKKEVDQNSLDTSCAPAQQAKIIQQTSQRPVEESCILVDGDEVRCFVPHENKNGKHKPYKKIRDAISSRMSSARKQEYKRLAHQWYAEDAGFGQECLDNTKPVGTEEKRSSVYQTSESDWELVNFSV